MKILQLSCAALFFGLAVAGAVLPLVPTTPFLLLSSWFLVRSSPRLNARLLASPAFGPLLRDWERHRGVRPRVKATAVLVILAVAGASLASGRLSPALAWALVALAGIGITVVLRLRTLRG